MGFKIRFWGVRGSIASPLDDTDTVPKAKRLLRRYRELGCPEDFETFVDNDPIAQFESRTHGGNTSCIEVVYKNPAYDDTNKPSLRFILDMGTGLRKLGGSLYPEMKRYKRLYIAFLVSHLHWDHIQGLPFFGPLFEKKEDGINNHWLFCGGTPWEGELEVCLHGQMDAPKFPVSWEKIRAHTKSLKFNTVWDKKRFTPDFDFDEVCLSEFWPEVYTRTLDHPQETYGWRLTGHDGKVFVYAADNEPRDPLYPDSNLLDLSRDADVLVIDTQYTQDQYQGIYDGVCRRGWGHQYDEAVAKTAVLAGVKKLVLFHHDPGSKDERIRYITQRTQALIRQLGAHIPVMAAHEGVEIFI